jgi:hypothetical protein
MTQSTTAKIVVKAKATSSSYDTIADFKKPLPPVSPTGSVEDEILVLRARNKVLTDALSAVKQSASKEMKRRFDLVWFARYRYRYPNHEASKRIEKEHIEDIKKLRGDQEESDFHHGFNTGLLAASRMFKKQADILHINDFNELTPDLMSEAQKHSKNIQDATKQFPHIEVNKDDFPQEV